MITSVVQSTEFRAHSTCASMSLSLAWLSFCHNLKRGEFWCGFHSAQHPAGKHSLIFIFRCCCVSSVLLFPCSWLFYASYAYQRHRHSKRRKSLAPSPTIQPPRDDSPGDMNDRGPDSTLRERHPVRTQVHQLKEKIDSLSVSTDSAGGASPQLTVNRGRISTVLPDNYAWVYGTDGQEIPGTPGSSGYQSSNENSSCASNDNSPSNVHRRVFFSEDTFQVPPTNAQNTKRRGKKEPEFFVVQV